MGRAKGGFLILEYQKSFSPLWLYPQQLEINVDLTPIKQWALKGPFCQNKFELVSFKLTQTGNVI